MDEWQPCNCIRTANYEVCAQTQQCPLTLVGLNGTVPDTYLVVEVQR